MSNTMMAQDVVIHESLRHLFDTSESFDIRNGGTPALLPEGDPLWVDQDAERFEESEGIGDNFFVIRVFDLATGEQLNRGVKLGTDWWRQQMGEFAYARFGRMMPNTYVVSGGILFISGGLWVCQDHPNEDGIGRFVSAASVRDADNRRRAEWLDEHAEVLDAVRPIWAADEEVWLDMIDEGDPDSIEFYRTVGTVRIEQAADVTGDEITLIGDPEIRVMHQDEPEFTPENAARIGVDLVAAAALFGEYVTVSELRKSAIAAGVTPGVLLQMTEG